MMIYSGGGEGGRTDSRLVLCCVVLWGMGCREGWFIEGFDTTLESGPSSESSAI